MTSFIVSLAVRLTVVMIAGGLVAVALRHSTYAVRHVVIAATLACAIALPPLMILIPEWRVGVLPSDSSKLLLVKRTHVITHAAPLVSTPVHSPTQQQTIRPILVTSALDNEPQVHTATAGAPFSPSIPEIAFGIWMLGVVCGLLWIAVGRFGLARVHRRATPLISQDWRSLLECERMHARVVPDVALLSSTTVSTPVTWGILSPVIVLPESASEWTPERRRVVVRHEMAHIARRDCATQLAATFASIIYWMHPLVIIAARHLRAECERACDERVLELGTPATDYAAHLLGVARFARSFGAASVVSVAMARPSQLEGRLLAVLRAAPVRARMSARSRAAALVTAAMMLIAISAFMPVQKVAKSRTIVRDAIATAHTSARASAAATATAQVAASPSARPSPGARPSARANTTSDMSADTSIDLTLNVTSDAIASATAAETLSVARAEIVARAARAEAASIAVATRVATLPKMAMFAKAVLFPRIASAIPAFGGSFRFDTKALFAPAITNGSPRHKADSTFEKSVSAHTGGTLELDLDTGGDLEILGTDDQKVSVIGALGGESWRETTVALEQHGGDAKLVSRYVGSSSTQSFDNSFTIHVPKRFNVHVMSAGGDVHISGVDGTFTGTTGGGTIAIEHANGEAHLATGGGDVHIAKSKLDGSVSTGGGTVRFDDVSGSIVGNAGGSRLRKRSFYFRMPEMESLSKLPEIEAESFEASREAMERANEAMARSQKEMWRAQAMMDSDSGMASMDSVMSRARITLERHRGAMDSARVMLDPYGNDRAHLRKALIRSRKLESQKGMANRESGVIVIDKDGGDIELGDAPDGAHVTTGGGAIIVGRSRGDVSAETGGGDIDLGPIDGAAEATTGAGDVSINLVGERAHPVDISSGKGNVELVLPKGANATLDLETAYTDNYGKHTKITSDWPLDVSQTQEWDSSNGTPRKYVRVRQNIGKGGPLIRIRTVNGDIRIKQGS